MAYIPDYVPIINPFPDVGTPPSLNPGQVEIPTKDKYIDDLSLKMDKMAPGYSNMVLVSDPATGESAVQSPYTLPQHGFMDLVPSAQVGKFAIFDLPAGSGQVGPAQHGDADIDDLQLNKMDKIGAGHDGMMALFDIDGQVYDGGLPASQGDIINIQNDITNIQNDIYDLNLNKMDKVSPATAGNTVILDSGGQVHDAGFAPVNPSVLGNYLPLTGGTMTGPIKLSSTNIEAANNPLNRIDMYGAYGRWNVEDNGQTELTFNSVAHPPTGGGWSNTIRMETDVPNHKNQIVIELIDPSVTNPRDTLEGVNIHNVVMPTEDLDAANKKYVDDSIVAATNVTGKADKVGPGHDTEVAFFDATGNLAVNAITLQDLYDIQNNITTLFSQFAGLSILGRLLASLATDADIATYVPPASASNPDYIIIQNDSAHGGANTYYVLDNTPAPISPPYTWTYGGTFGSSISGKMDLVPGAVPGNIATYDGAGQVLDSGYNHLTWVNALASAANNNIALWDGLGQQKDSGVMISDLATVVALNGETLARQQGDAALNTAITNVANDLLSEVSDRHTAVQAEETARIAADAVLQLQITQEVTNRTNADTAIETALNTHVADNVRHITAAERTAWNAKASAVAIPNDHVAVGDGTFIKDSGISMTNVTLTQMPTTIKSIAFYATEAAAKAASVVNPTWLCFYPEP